MPASSLMASSLHEDLPGERRVGDEDLLSEVHVVHQEVLGNGDHGVPLLNHRFSLPSLVILENAMLAADWVTSTNTKGHIDLRKNIFR